MVRQSAQCGGAQSHKPGVEEEVGSYPGGEGSEGRSETDGPEESRSEGAESGCGDDVAPGAGVPV